jgi:hypothetical protein
MQEERRMNSKRRFLKKAAGLAGRALPAAGSSPHEARTRKAPAAW